MQTYIYVGVEYGAGKHGSWGRWWADVWLLVTEGVRGDGRCWMGVFLEGSGLDMEVETSLGEGCRVGWAEAE